VIVHLADGTDSLGGPPGVFFLRNGTGKLHDLPGFRIIESKEFSPETFDLGILL
jgi:hypothetical protein